ncbi:unnamed protein product [marine sediment metagenome]|uniref:Uncharacterized protein n=1 Tax=marine sediment metagenome TaxID=412755 RepID=X1F1M3_9ZZZZ
MQGYAPVADLECEMEQTKDFEKFVKVIMDAWDKYTERHSYSEKQIKQTR